MSHPATLVGELSGEADGRPGRAVFSLFDVRCGRPALGRRIASGASRVRHLRHAGAML